MIIENINALTSIFTQTWDDIRRISTFSHKNFEEKILMTGLSKFFVIAIRAMIRGQQIHMTQDPESKVKLCKLLQPDN